ncbi:MocR-like pyridoxine biosynthesis transcription factor PdxR [Microbulbifer sp. TRSA005]|uniref:MocR-like pyridoxine biosynthesis transcription factor PdxR n=1 Tax=Microbulbifer sp. TRSA005 TaxID=3243383 RepID=UPI0040394F87
MNAPDLSDLSINRNKPLQKQLYKALIERIINGRLLAGVKLPSSRRMSECLDISRNTVTQTIEQLKNEGFLTSRVGKGVFVSKNLPSFANYPDERHPHNDTLNSATPLPSLSVYSQMLNSYPRFMSQWPTLLPFSPGVPDLKAFPFSIWNKLYRQHQDRIPINGYGNPIGYLPLREWLAEYLLITRGVRCAPDQIIITNGRQEALNICAKVFLEQNDSILMENPGFWGAKLAFESMNAKINLVGLKNNHLDVDLLPQINVSEKLLYTTPTYQYPMGGILPPLERNKLLDWADKNQCWIIEDESNSIFSFNGNPYAALQGMRNNTPVIFIGSFNRALLPSLRLGYLVVPKPVVSSFVSVKSVISGPSTLLPQAIIADFMNEGHFVRHTRRMQKKYQKKWEHFHRLTQNRLEPNVNLITGSGIMFAVLSTPHHDDKWLSEKLHKKGFGNAPLSLSDANEKKISGLILGCANTNSSQRENFVDYLAHLLNSDKRPTS